MKPRDTRKCMAERWQRRVSGPTPRPADVGGQLASCVDGDGSCMRPLADIVADKVRSDLGIEGEASSRSYDEGGMENDDGDHVPKSRKLEK